MTARDFVLNSVGKKQMVGGVEGYVLAKTMTNFDKPLATKIHPGKKKTFIDDEVKVKAIVPDAKYNLNFDWAADKRSNFSKDFRHTLATDIERHAKKVAKPEPATYKLEHKHV